MARAIKHGHGATLYDLGWLCDILCESVSNYYCITVSKCYKPGPKQLIINFCEVYYYNKY